MTLNEIRRSEDLNYIEGLDVINVGLGAVLYDTNLHKYYTPNNGIVGDLENNEVSNVNQESNLDKMLEGHELAEAYDESGNSAERASESQEDEDEDKH